MDMMYLCVVDIDDNLQGGKVSITKPKLFMTKARETKGETQESLGKKLGIRRGQLASLESGCTVNISHTLAKRLEKELGYPMEKLIKTVEQRRVKGM